MKSKWIKVGEFDFVNETEFDCYIFIHGEIRKAHWNLKIFDFKNGMCGKNVPTHVMKIKVPKKPKIN
jgi:hypothetical protein